MDEPKVEKPRTLMRRPSEESVDLYPGLCVCDDRVSGSITVGQSRLPLWTFIGTIVTDGWETVAGEEGDFPQTEKDYGWTQQKMSDFLYYAMQSRGEFGRLTLLMAELNRVGDQNKAPWIEEAEHCQQMREQLQRCLDALAE